MKGKIPSLVTCLRLTGAIILVVGLGSAILVYRSAGKGPYGVLGYEASGGSIYPIIPEDSKQYMRSMELYGGKANVLVAEFRRRLASLGHGKSLAFIIACATIMISVGLFYEANHWAKRPKPEAPGENHLDAGD